VLRTNQIAGFITVPSWKKIKKCKLLSTGVVYKVIVKTGAKKNGGTDAKVYNHKLKVLVFSFLLFLFI